MQRGVAVVAVAAELEAFGTHSCADTCTNTCKHHAATTTGSTHSQPQELRVPQPAHGDGVPKNTVPAPPSRRMLTTRIRRPGLSCGRTSTDCSASLYGNTGMAGFGAEPGVASAPAPAPAPAPPAPARPSPATSLVATFDEHVSSDSGASTVGRDAGSQVESAMDAVSDASTTYVMYTAP